MGFKIQSQRLVSPRRSDFDVPARKEGETFRGPVALKSYSDGFEPSSRATGSPALHERPSAPAPAPAPAARFTTDSRGFPRGQAPVVDGKVEVPGLGTFPAPAPGKKTQVNLDKKNKLVLKRNADGTVSVQVKKRGGLLGFLKKLGGVLLKALPIASKILSFIPGLNVLAAPLAAVSRVVGAVKGGIDAIRSGDFAGAIGAVVGGFKRDAPSHGASQAPKEAARVHERTAILQ